MKTLEQTLWSKSRYWWIVLLPGIILIPCGCWFLFSPTVGYFTITTTLLWILILIGITQLIIAFNTTRQSHRWGWWLAGGIIDVFIGIMMLNNISFSAMILPYFFAFTFLFKGVINVVSSFASMGYNTSWWLYLINGLLQLVLSTLFFMSPFSAMIAIDFLIGASFIYWGISLIFLARDLRPDSSKEEKHTIPEM